MKIRKVEDKTMIIHTKEKMTIHKHEKEGTQKGEVKKMQASPEKSSSSRKLFRKHDFKSDSSKSIKLKSSSIKLAGATSAKVAVNQMEGGEEVQRASGIAYGATRMMTSGIKKSANIYQRGALIAKRQRVKKVELGKKFAKKGMNKAVTSTVKKTMKKGAKETAKATAKTTAKVGAEVVGTAAGTATTGVGGVVIGKAVGKAVGDKLDRLDVASTNRGRVLKFFLDKMNAENKQSDSIGKLIKDLFANRARLFLMKAIMPIVSALLGFFLMIVIACVPVILVIAVLYNSPFAMFLPPLEAGDTVISVAKEYESSFNQQIDYLVAEHVDCDMGNKIYVDYEGSAAVPSNMYDVVAVYMVKYGVGDTATVMNDLSKQRLKTIFDDMCYYTTSVETVTTEQEDGTETEQKILHVYVYLKSYRDMVPIYHFKADEVEMLEQIMSPENMAMVGYSSNSGESNEGEAISELSENQIAEILIDVTDHGVKKH